MVFRQIGEQCSSWSFDVEGDERFQAFANLSIGHSIGVFIFTVECETFESHSTRQ
jgi:hypothetical protein